VQSKVFYEEVSMNPGVRLPTWGVFAVASVAGLLISASDFASPFGDDSARLTIVLWLAASAVLGFARPGRAWRWALSVGPWLPLSHLVAQAFGLRDPIQPNGYTTILILVPVSIAVCVMGAYGGVLARRLVAPTFPSLGAGMR
jgi:hypothetical protein